ncbi:hypothetical protein ABB28_11015 [Stenotrophomonas chelatiphaga]|uniref:Uncharacterized protein n=1 Tax=Stenotrophomonas chelatiphaga TaxID=517011 RepID=A0A0R0CTZ0_9GAMM|nr:hypothetical protein ABB28_11015 [Stenotrophomonas chelatiphaga]MCS4232368.1 hypothetical protein [Stenotrophomonas chelatiphaga]ROQ43765.1 hypothetical protein EDF77_1529 [Stenotrophomonas maltophilia]
MIRHLHMLIAAAILFSSTAATAAVAPYQCTFLLRGAPTMQRINADSEIHAKEIIRYEHGYFNVDRLSCNRV